MSLLARYLFANNTESAGIIQTTTLTEPTYSQEGPFGYCMTGTFKIRSTTSIQYPEIYNPKSQSISLWYKVDNLSSGINVSGCSDIAAIYGIRIFPDGTIGLICGANNFVLNTDAGIFTTNTWHNIIVTNDNLLFTIYLDGVQVAQGTYTNGSNWNCKSATEVPLGNAPSSQGAKLADLRFYDHILSKKEIKDIQKAVSCHISFENISPTYMNRLCPDLFYPTSDWTFNSCEWDSGSVLFQTGTTSMLTRSTTGISPTGNHKYYGSVEYKVEGTSMTWADNRFEWFLNDNTNARVTFFGCPATTNFGWVKESAIVTAADTMQSGTYSIRLFTVNSTLPWRARNPLIVDLTEMFGAGNEPTKEWCDEHIDYFNGVISDNLSDNSGGFATITAHNLFTCKGDPTYGIPVGQQCGVFYCVPSEMDNSYIRCLIRPFLVRTYSMWFRYNPSEGNSYLIGARSVTAVANYGIDISISTTNQLRISYNDLTTTTSITADSDWHYICLCVDDPNIYVYFDGVLAQTITQYTTYTGYGSSILIGAYIDNPLFQQAIPSFSGMIADVKFSGVPWTAEQVQDEYQSKIVLDKSYNLYSSYFETPKPKIPNLMLTTLGSTQWQGGSVSTDHTRVDPSSRLMTGTAGQPESLSSLPQMAYMTLNHIYYSGFYCLREDTTASQSVQIYIPVAEPSLMSGVGLTSQPRVWQKCTARSTWAGSGWVNGLQAGRIDYNNQNSAGECWFTDMWIVDLTQYFGSGNEPTKEWCDKYLEYSPEGLIILDEPTKFKKTESIINSKYSEVGVKGRYIKIHMNSNSGSDYNYIQSVSYFDKDGGEINLISSKGVIAVGAPSNMISGYISYSIFSGYQVDTDTVIDIGSVVDINAIRLVRDYNMGSRYYYNTIISISENNTDYVEIYNSYNNGSYGNDDRTNTYYETSDGKVFPAVAAKYSQAHDTIKTTSIREVI